jgi:hypothetical protein
MHLLSECQGRDGAMWATTIEATLPAAANDQHGMVNIPFPDGYTLDLVRTPQGGIEIHARLLFADPARARRLAESLTDHLVTRHDGGEPLGFG